ncbi:hypothetical protein AJ79_08189 [Helicocarpus griseus UAMH5409]|uniref:RBR-type E3 ubiquitin transferase n=1 Tax=Helicocarpus griseus UAMH5409 TaxID=1447875 RepID=A0A2B7WVM7_9EURO|nr:hypothetical protein AJ79_08189 [Helicocarpus griseus UAMH5409]
MAARSSRKPKARATKGTIATRNRGAKATATRAFSAISKVTRYAGAAFNSAFKTGLSGSSSPVPQKSERMVDVPVTQQVKPSLPNNKLAASRKKKKDRSDAFRECIICAEKKPLGRKGANFPAFPRCEHEPLACSDCLLKHTIINLKTRARINHNEETNKTSIDWSTCTCPQCNTSLTESELRSVLNRNGNAIVTRIATRKELQSHPRWTWCLSVTCSSGQIFPETSPSQQVVCVKCKKSSCFLHGVPWHENYTCSQYDDKHPNAQSARSSEERIKRMTKKCPNRQCGWRIQKNGGCPNMYCIKCGRSFRWDKVKYDGKVTPEPETFN